MFSMETWNRIILNAKYVNLKILTSEVLKPCSQQTTTTQLSLWATFGPLDTYLQFMIHKIYVLSPSHKVLWQSGSFDSEGIELSFHIRESNTPLRNEQEDRENSRPEGLPRLQCPPGGQNSLENKASDIQCSPRRCFTSTCPEYLLDPSCWSCSKC